MGKGQAVFAVSAGTNCDARQGSQSIHAPAVEGYVAAVSLLTGISLSIIGPGADAPPNCFSCGFCSLIRRPSYDKLACRSLLRQVNRGGVALNVTHRVACKEIVSTFLRPVAVGDTHVATLSTSPVLHRQLTDVDIAIALVRDGRAPDAATFERAKAICSSYPVVSVETARAILDRFAQFVADAAAAAAMRNPGSARDSASPGAAGARCATGIVGRAETLISELVVTGITSAGIAGRLRVSHGYLCRLFKRETGKTLTRFIAQARVARAVELLGNTTIPITRVAEGAGFGSIAQFNAVFRQIAGRSPTQYRAACRDRSRGREVPGLRAQVKNPEEKSQRARSQGSGVNI